MTQNPNGFDIYLTRPQSSPLSIIPGHSRFFVFSVIHSLAGLLITSNLDLLPPYFPPLLLRVPEGLRPNFSCLHTSLPGDDQLTTSHSRGRIGSPTTFTTQLYDSKSEHLKNDAVFAVKEDQLVKFEPRAGDPRANWTLGFNFVLSNSI